MITIPTAQRTVQKRVPDIHWQGPPMCIGPVHPAPVAELIGEYIEQGAQGDAVIGTFGVVPMQPLAQAIVETAEVAERQSFAVPDIRSA